MGDSSLFVSNGTCYTSAGKELDKQFIPCGNDAFGHQTCCGAGDNCLADNACFGVHGSGYGSMLTYFGGCTDPDYKDKTCPDKKGIDQPWIALTLCDNGDGVWGACSQEGNPSTLQPGSYCSCTDASAFTPVAFSDSTVLASFASLPTGTGGSIAFAAGHAPTSPPADATTEPSASQSNSGAASSGGTPTETGSNAASRTGSGSNASSTGSNGSATGSRASSASSTASGSTDPSSSNPSTSKSSSGKAIGIAVGVGVAAILLIAMAAFFLIRRRRRRRQPRGTQPITASELEKKDPLPVDAAKPAQPRMSGVESTTVSEADGRPISKGDHPGTSELAGASVLEADGKGVSKAARPGTFELDSSNVVEADGHTARPWNMGSEMGGGQGVGVHHDVGHGVVRPDGHLSPVAELPGSGVPRRDYAPPGVRTRD